MKSPDTMTLFATLIGAHAVADYPLQGEFLALAKNRAMPVSGVPWYQALGAHAVIHGLAVGIVTRNLKLGVAETIAHILIDDAKCHGLLTFDQDQGAHLLCKAAWAIIAARKSPATV